jgi:hypothetical protein
MASVAIEVQPPLATDMHEWAGGYKRLANVATYSEKILKKIIYKKLR